MSCPDTFPKPVMCTLQGVQNIVIKEYDIVVETL
jgi:hypothetical protein